MLAAAPKSPVPDHAHDHGHEGHSHGPGHTHADSHGHSHAHHEGHGAARKARLKPIRSLIALSAGQRLVMALPLIAGLWLAAFWAMS